MGNPYSQPVLTGYNSSAPPDDGTAVAANALKWSNHINKIGDPLKNFAQAIDTNASSAFDLIFGNTISSHSTNYTVLTTDQGKFLEATAALTFTLLPVATANANFALAIINTSSGVVTLDGDGAETINGSTTITLNPGESIILTCNGTKWVGAVSALLGSNVSTKGGNYTVVVSDKGTFIEVTAAATITLLPAATAGRGFPLAIINSGTGIVTIDGDTSETINGATTIDLIAGGGAILSTDGSKWVAVTSGSLEVIKVKTADKSLASNITLEDDNHLFGWNLTADKYYSIEGFIAYTQNIGDIKVAFQLSDAAQLGQWSLDATDVANAVEGRHLANITGQIPLVGMGDGLAAGFQIHGTFKANATTGGTLDFQWAQDTSDANNTTVRDGSWIKIKQLD